MSSDSDEKILEQEFREIALRRSELLRRNDAKKANEEYDKLHKLKNRMRQLPDRGEAALKRISTLHDVEVQLLAAAALLAVDELFATALLSRIQRDNPGLPGFDAQMTLREWKSGSIREYWS